jgi:outer membrane lipoprotein SlyB
MKKLIAAVLLTYSSIASAQMMGEVIGVQPIMGAGHVQYMYTCEQKSPSVAGPIIGGVLGAVVGNHVGGDVGAVVGGIAGVVVGDDVSNKGNNSQCATRPIQMQTITAYAVTVRGYNGSQLLGLFSVPMTHAPPLGSYVQLRIK